MNQSSLKTKEPSKISTISSPATKKGVIDYRDYQQQLSEYQRNAQNERSKKNIANLYDWSSPNQLISIEKVTNKQTSSKKSDIIKNDSMNTDQLLRSEKDVNENRNQQYELDNSFEQLSSPSSPLKLSPKFSRSYQQYQGQSNAVLEKQIKEMREKMIKMNEKLNSMLDRYELMSRRYVKQQAKINNPHLFLSREIELNIKILSSQGEEIRQLQEKDKELELKDYLVELGQLVIEAKKGIHDLGKEKHEKWVDVERIDRMLKEIQDIQQNQTQYREVKNLKTKIIHYFKKLQSQRMEEEQLDLQLQKATQKDANMALQLDHFSRIAVQQSLQVSINKKFLQTKKKYQQLIIQIDNMRKKNAISLKSQTGIQEKTEKQIQSMKKQLQKIQMIIQQTEYKALTVEETTNQILKAFKVSSQSLKPISYRFDESLIHPQKAQVQKFKPDFRAKSRTRDLSTTIDHSGAIKGQINDKNITIDYGSTHNQLSESKLKPPLRQWKGKSERARYSQTPTSQPKQTEQQTKFKPSLLLRSRK